MGMRAGVGRLHGSTELGPRVLWFRGSSQLLDHGTSQGRAGLLLSLGCSPCTVGTLDVLWRRWLCGFTLGLPALLQYLLCPLDGTASRPRLAARVPGGASPQHSDGQRPQRQQGPLILGSGNTQCRVRPLTQGELVSEAGSPSLAELGCG